MMAASASVTGVFDRARHSYSFRGERLISVTQAIRLSGLMETAWYTDAARDRGRLVHMAVQFDAEGDLEESTVDPVIMPYVEAARKFRQDTGFVAETNEQQLFAPTYGFAGTVDGYGKAGDVHVVCDFKSGVVPFWTRYQLAAYCSQLPHGPGSLRWGVQLKPDGKYKITNFDPKDYRTDFHDFLAMLRVCQIRQESGLLEL